MLEVVVYCSDSAGAAGGMMATTTYTMLSSPIVLLAVHVKFPEDCSFTSVGGSYVIIFGLLAKKYYYIFALIGWYVLLII